MKKLRMMALCCIVLMVISQVPALASDIQLQCPHDDQGWKRRETRWVSQGSGGHLTYYVMDYFCTECFLYLRSTPEFSPDAEFHSYEVDYGNYVYQNNASEHWKIVDKLNECKYCGYKEILESGIVQDREAHYADHNTWIDAGHSGVYHYYDNICKKSTCGRRFRWRTISCPGGSNHIAPNVWTPPIELETE